MQILKNFNLVFFLITFLLIICAILIITSKNPIHSILFLVLLFIITTILFLTLSVDFIAMLFLVLYVGAIVVLFLFVVMMLNVRILELNERVISYIPIAIIIVFIFFILILSVITANFVTESSKIFFVKSYFFELFNNYLNYIINNQNYYLDFTTLNNYNNLNLLGVVLYKNYFYIFILASIVLLVAMIGSIILTLTEKSKVKSKRQNFYLQTNKNIIKSIRHFK